MGIIGNNVVTGFGDVAMAGKMKGVLTDPVAQIRFSQLSIPQEYISDVIDSDNVDKTVTPITLVLDRVGLENLHRITGEMLERIEHVQQNI